MKKLYTLILLIFFYLISGSLYSASYVMEPSDSSMFYYDNNIAFSKKIGGMKYFIVSDNSQTPTYYHDLLMHFDSNLVDITGNYEPLTTTYISKYSSGKYGDASLFLPSENYFVELIPKNSSSFFSTSDNISSFTIEFFLKPNKFLINAGVLSKIGPYHTEGGLNTYGGITSYVRENKLIWNFNNFFFLNGQSRNIELSNSTFLEENKWSHHSITFDATTGKLTKYLNGLEEEFIYVTSTGDEYGSIYYPKFDKNNHNPIVIGDSFLGNIDELSISTIAKTNFNIEQYRHEGLILSKVIDFESPYALVNSLDVQSILTNGSDVLIYYRASPIYFLPNDSVLEWKTFEPGTDINILSRYLQIKLVLLSSDFNKTTPLVGTITVNYDIVPPPPVPTDFNVYPLNGGVRLTWNNAGQYSSVVGYKIYYGTKPGIYDSVGSPIVIGKTNEHIINNLDNGKIYYFSISAFDDISEYHQSDFSKEVYTRPRSFYSNENRGE